jgi:hypothetical protein
MAAPRTEAIGMRVVMRVEFVHGSSRDPGSR